MEPLTTMLIAAFTAAAGALAGGIAEAAGGDVWAATKRKLTGWTRLDQRARAQAFDQAVKQALMLLRKRYSDEDLRDVGLLLQHETPESRRFLQAAVEELVLSARPNMGRLVDLYRREIRFVAALRGQALPPWAQLEPLLREFLDLLLPDTLAQQQQLRPLLLEQAELAALDEARATARAPAEGAATLQRIEARLTMLLDQLAERPRLTQQIITGDDGSITQVQQIVVQGDYYAAPELARPDLEALFRRYQSYLVETHSLLDFRGILQVQNVVKLPLEEVYVPLRATYSQRVSRFEPAKNTRVSRDTFSRLSGVAESADEQAGSTGVLSRETGIIDAHTLVRDRPLLVVLGDPGAGKSTLVRYVMLALSEGHAVERLGLTDEWLPILFPVAAFAEARERDPDLAPLDYLRAFYRGLSQPDYGPLFRQALRAGRALVLLDGLDEVREGRRTLTHCLEAFVREWDLPGNRFIATSRIAGYDDASLDEGLFTRTTIQPFDDDDIRLFARRWSLAFEHVGAENVATGAAAQAEVQRRAETRAESLIAAIFATTNVTELARNPLLLTILALIHNQGTRLPDRRVDLYRLCVEALAETWNRARSLSGREIDVYLGDEKLDERFVVNLLGPAALWIHEENPGGLVEQRDLERRLADTLAQTDGLPQGKAQRLAGDFVDLVRRHTGLLQERGHRRYGFLHLTFEEYLAARALVESATVDNADDLIHQRCIDAGWREVLRLALASVPQKEAQRLLLHLLAAPTSGDSYGRQVVLAGECLLDIGRNGATRRAWDAVIAQLVGLLADSQAPTALRVEGGHVLGRLGDPRLLNPATGEAAGIESYANVPGYWCAVEAGVFWYGDETEDEEDSEDDAEDVAGDDEAGNSNQATASGDSAEARASGKLRQMRLDYDFKIARYPVTNAEYQRFVEAGGYQEPRWWTEQGWQLCEQRNWTEPRYWNDPTYNSPAQPVVGVSWYEAVAYCRWLTAQGHERGWLPKDAELRLPTSLEYERAARHTDQRRYPWSSEQPDPDRMNYKATGINAPAPVGCFLRGTAVCGARDMVGNVLEWMATPYEQPNQVDPVEDFTPDKDVMLHYGYFGASEEQMSCGARFRGNPGNRSGDRSFRVIWSERSSE